jgi:hypothetical protein
MKFSLLLLTLSFFASNLVAEKSDFDAAPVGTVPNDWMAGVTGPGVAQWAVMAEQHPRSATIGRGSFPQLSLECQE